MDVIHQDWIASTAAAAKQAGHIFPEMAAAEAALESNFGRSTLAVSGNNLFGMKQHTHPVYGTLSLPTHEYLNGQYVAVNADWVKYPTLEECFADRMATLRRLQDVYPEYAAALAAPDAYGYVYEVSRRWSTDPKRADKVSSIYQTYFGSNNSENVQEATAGEN